MKKKIGIVTILKVNNYGAELQAYATQRVMNLMGYDAEIIDYLFYRNLGHIKERCSMPFYPYPLKNRIKEWGLHIIDIGTNLFQSKSYRRRIQRFEEFHLNHNRLSKKQYCRYSELFTNPPIYDAYCVGSDQVWNPRCYTNLNPYFLKFAPDNAVKFSYASSFGVCCLPQSAFDQYKEGLNNLTHISVREKQGVELVSRIAGKDAEWVADPTLLLTSQEWQTVENRIENIPDKYVLVYELHPIEKITEVALSIAERLGCNIINICKSAYSAKKNKQMIYITDAGPSEFIYLFHHASFVVTNSFHGTAFSINFRKDFYCVLSKSLKNNGRQIGLLDLCNLTDRIIFNDKPIPEDKNIAVDYSGVTELFNEFRNKSMEYIRRTVDGK